MEKRRLSAVAVVVGLLLPGTVAAGSGKSYRLSARLDARQDVPRQVFPAPAARGELDATLTTHPGRGSANGGLLTWRLRLSGLSGRIVAVHIHFGRPGRRGALAISLCGPCRADAHGAELASTTAVSNMLQGATYVDVHTGKNKRGEIRGQIKVVP